MKRRNLILALAAAAFVSGCATTAQIPVELQYAPPSGNVAVARIVGSEEKSLLLDNFTAFILSVDGKRVMAGRKGWNVPIAIEAGHRVLTVEFNRGVFVARVDLELEAVAGANYELKYVSDTSMWGRNSFVDFWISDTATRQAVTNIKRGSISGGGNDVYVPIFIPAK